MERKIMAATLFRVADLFTIRGRSVVITGQWAEPATGQSIRIGDPIAIVRADGSRFRTTVRGIEPFARAHPSGKWVGVLLGSAVRREDVAPGDEVIRVDGFGDLG